jgi:peptide/nickel transport system permease protein
MDRSSETCGSAGWKGAALVVFLIRRLLQAVVVLLIVTMLTFAALRMIPGNVAVAVMGPGAYRNPAAIRLFDADYGFNLPWYRQYFLWLGNIVRGNLGFSWTLNQSVASLLANRMPKTIILVGISTVLALILAIPIGVLQAVRRNRATDHVFNAVSTIFYSTPDFLIGILLILVFAIKIPILPAEGPQGEGLGAVFTDFNALILPIFCLAATTVALFSRYMRSSVLDNLTEDYVRTARAKGASEKRVLIRHVMRNALSSTVTLLGLSLPGILAGALITEAVFNYPGMGYLFYQSAQRDDYPVLLGFTVVVAVATVIGSLLADVAYAMLDPRVRYVGG